MCQSNQPSLPLDFVSGTVSLGSTRKTQGNCKRKLLIETQIAKDVFISKGNILVCSKEHIWVFCKSAKDKINQLI